MTNVDQCESVFRAFGHRLVLVRRQHRLEARMLVDRVPARVEPQRVDAQPPWSCEELLDLIERGIYLTTLREDHSANLHQPRSQDGIDTIDERLP